MGIVYLILWPDGSKYVGSTRRNLSARMANHRFQTETGTTELYRVAREFGWESAIIEVLEECDNYLESEDNYRRLYKDELLNMKRVIQTDEEKIEMNRACWRNYAERNRERRREYWKNYSQLRKFRKGGSAMGEP